MTLAQFLSDILEATAISHPGEPTACAVACLVDPDGEQGVAIVDAHDAVNEIAGYTGCDVNLYFAHGLLAGFDGEEWYEPDNAADANGYTLGCRLRKEVRE